MVLPSYIPKRLKESTPEKKIADPLSTNTLTGFEPLAGNIPRGAGQTERSQSMAYNQFEFWRTLDGVTLITAGQKGS